MLKHVGDIDLPAHTGSGGFDHAAVHARPLLADLPVPGRTRWTVYDPAAEVFHVNVMDPAVIAVVEAGTPAVSRMVSVPAVGPHGLDLDVAARRLFCACDGGRLVEI